MVAITDATLRDSVWETLYDFLDGITYSSSVQPGVYRNNSDVDEDDTFPRVILYPVNPTSERTGFGQSNYSNRIEVVVEIYATKNRDLDLIADDIHNDFETRNFTGMSYVGGNDAFQINTEVNQKIHSKIITFTFMRG